MLESLYSFSLHRTICTILCFLIFCVLITKDDNQYFKKVDFKWLTILLCIFFVLFFGYRPVRFMNESNDTNLYTIMFDYVKSGHWNDNFEKLGDPFFRYVELLCAKFTDATGWYVVVAMFYIGGMAFVSFYLFPRHSIISILFLISSFSFIGFGGNGIRNGMASSIALIGLAVLSKYSEKKNWKYLVTGFAFLILAYYTHRSMSLVLICGSFALFFSKNVKINLLLWVICVALSAIFGDYLTKFVSQLSGDERMIYYGYAEIDSSLFSKTGFRWDFILYSSLPIILAAWTAFFGKPTDNKYNFLINTYILANAAWALVNQIAYSNRFAYLSWFMMPIVLAYPLCKIKIVNNQSLLCGLFLIIQLLILYVFGS